MNKSPASVFEKLSVELTGPTGNIMGVTGGSVNMVWLRRRLGSHCNICHRRHQYDEILKVVEKCCDCFVMFSDRLVVGCFRANTKKKIIITRAGKIYSYEKYVKSFQYCCVECHGEFPTKTPDWSYTVPPRHESGNGCMVICEEDNLDGFTCGMGKSEVVWKSLGGDKSVLIVSYRKTFTEKIKQDFGLESYNDSVEDIVFASRTHRRVITQIESVVRV